MYKVVGLLKRKPGMSSEAFRDYYETYHRVIGEKYLKEYAVKYMRRYLSSFPDPITGSVSEQPFDVLLEVWYRDRQACVEAHLKFQQPDVAEEIAEDEEKLFDRPKSRFFSVEESESNLSD